MLLALLAALPTNSGSHVSRDLQQLYSYSRGVGVAGHNAGPTALQQAFPRLLLGAQGAASVLVRIMARDVAALRPRLEALGFVTVSARPQLHFIEVSCR